MHHSIILQHILNSILPIKQTLVVDFSTSMYAGHSYSDYVEKYPGSTHLINDIHTYIKGP